MSELFLAACDLPGADREAFLTEACAGDDVLLAAVRRLLKADDDTGNLFEVDGIGDDIPVLDMTAAETGSSGHPESIGPFQIVREVGRGGMGVVYEAVQSSPKRRVAVKVIRPLAFNASLIRRFQQEAEVLGRLQHPGVAQIYAAGSIAEGPDQSPYIAMEYIEGRGLLSYAKLNDLDHRAKLELVARIADAVHHAHQKGVIHRDMKPDNVLVTDVLVTGEQTGTQTRARAEFGLLGQPKVLDFGIARATDAEARVTTMGTEPGKLLGTLAYMSPEQVSGAEDIDVRTDVYSIGVIAYELLAGRKPFEFSGGGIAEAALKITESEPPKLGTLAPAARGDAETIVAKAMSKSRMRRYQSASELAADIRRYLGREAILAHPPSAVYQLRRLASRNKPLFVASGLGVAALVAGLVVSLVALAESNRQTDIAKAALEDANEQREIAETIERFMDEDILGQADVTQNESGDPTVRGMLDRAAEGLGNRFVDQPSVEQRIRMTIGRAYLTLSAFGEALPQLERAHELTAESFGPDDERSLNAQSLVTVALMELARVSDAVVVLADLAERTERTLGDEHRLTLSTMNSLGVAYLRMGDFQRGAEIVERTCDIKRRVLGPTDPSTLTSVNTLAGVLQVLGRLERSRDLYEEAVEGRAEALGEGHPSTVASLSGLAAAEQLLDRWDEAEAAARRAIRAGSERLDPSHILMTRTQLRLIDVLAKKGDFEAVDRVVPPLMETIERNYPAAHTHRVGAVLTVSQADMARGRPEDCIERLEATVAAVEGNSGRTREHGQLLLLLGRAYTSAERFDQARQALIGARSLLMASQGPNSPEVAEIDGWLAELPSPDGPR